jgi:CRISPR-associated protein Cas6
MLFVEVKFQVMGVSIGRDHPTQVLSCIKRILDSNSECCLLLSEHAPDCTDLLSFISISRIIGLPNFSGIIFLTESSDLRLRLPEWLIVAVVKALDGQIFDINGHIIRLLRPELIILQHEDILCSRLVIFDSSIDYSTSDLQPLLRVEPFNFESLLKIELDAMGINATPSIELNNQDNYAFRTIGIDGKHFLGYGVRVHGLGEADSIKLQSIGLGKGKHFGCGWFSVERGFSN